MMLLLQLILNLHKKNVYDYPAKRKIPVALQNILDNHTEVTSIALHLDNDHAGKAATWAIQGLLQNKYNISYEPPLRGNDYKDYLMRILPR